MNYFKHKRGQSKYFFMRACFGGGGAPSAPSYVSPAASELPDETERVKRYNTSLEDIWEPFYNQVPEAYNGYLSGLAAQYPDIASKKASIGNELFNFLPQTNVLSPEFQRQAQANYDIRKERGLDAINDLYSPLERKVTGKAFQNYGGMENSAYRDMQGRLAKERGKMTDEYVNQMDLQRQAEEQQQLAMQSQYLGNLGNAYNMANMASQEYPQALTTVAGLGNQGVTTYNDLINAIRSLAIQRAALANEFNSSMYGMQSALYAQQPNWGMAALGAGTSLLGGLI